MTHDTDFMSAETTILRQRLTAVTGLAVVTPYGPTQGDCAVGVAEQVGGIMVPPPRGSLGGGGGGVGGGSFGGLEGNLASVLRF
ncbi:hypothetical protein ACRDNQ_01760 [Palleronia sp. KMU-117]|uniref:hypothetical protein n=1 Tax=Palleronia sp. KMU-117 TaxID=3434108 RepID=UPI003D731647